MDYRLDVLFPTLRSVGYERCAHPSARRTKAGRCKDCGAEPRGVAPDGRPEVLGGSLDHRREPLVA